jgi:Polyketide cyclase / dehydrase and lipid transport
LHDWKDSLKGVLAGALAGIAVGIAGFLLSRIPGTHAMGPVVFLLVPLAAGFAITMVSHAIQRVSAAAILATAGSLGILIAMRMETPLCALLALPLLFVGLLVGVGLGYLFLEVAAKRDRNKAAFMSLVWLSMPMLFLAGHRAEIATLTHPRREVVTSAIKLPASPDQVWAELRSFDSLAGRKPLLMYVGLPVPLRCAMEGSGVGAKRTCYFDNGYIQETITEWSPPHAMELSIDRTNLPGRHWLEFETARYDLQQDADGTILTRSTTIISNLYPAWYWRGFERWGVSSEHRYIFSDLAIRQPQATSRAR